MSHAGCSQRSKYACVQAATASCEPFGTQAQALRPPRACRSFSACRAASLERRALFVWHLQYGPSSSRPDRRHAALWSRHRSAAAVTMAASVSQLACHTAPRQPGPRAFCTSSLAKASRLPSSCTASRPGDDGGVCGPAGQPPAVGHHRHNKSQEPLRALAATSSSTPRASRRLVEANLKADSSLAMAVTTTL